MAKKNQKNPGKVGFLDNKLRIEFKLTNSTESILFEDISSMSSSKVWGLNWLYILLGFIFFIIMTIIGVSVGDSEAGPVIVVIGVAGTVAGFILSIIFKKIWDDVVVETRGGKQVKFSVPEGKGIETVDSIENEKRKHS